MLALDGSLGGLARLVRERRLPLAQLAGQFVGYLFQCEVKIVGNVLGEDVGPRNGEMHADLVAVARSCGIRVQENDVGTDDINAEFFQLTDLCRNSLVNGCREGHVTGAEMNLHVAVDELAQGAPYICCCDNG